MLRSTILCLVALRLAIGWHFLVEGYEKVRKTYAGPGDLSKPFTSEGYFRNADGPLGELMRQRLSDPHREALALLTLKPGNTAGKERIPDALEQQWNDYFARFEQHFALSPEQKKIAQAKLDQAKEDVVQWLLTGTKEVKKTYPSGTVEIKQATDERIREYQLKLQEIADLISRREPSMFNKDVEKKRLPTAKADADKMRKELLEDLDEQTKRMKERLIDTFRDGMPTLPLGKDPRALSNDAILALVKLDNENLPKEVVVAWDAYAAQFATNFKLSKEQQADLKKRIEKAKTLYIRWLSNQDETTGTPLPTPEVTKLIQNFESLHRQATGQQPVPTTTPDGKKWDMAKVQAYLAEYREELLKGLQRQQKNFVDLLDMVLTPEQREATVPPAKKPTVTDSPFFDWDYNPQHWTLVDWVDWGTRWGLLIMGALLLLGLFTRTAALAAALFLLMTYLTVPPFPWLSAPPNQEGTYYYVNKNTIEMLALLVLLTVPSGRWFGVDAMLAYWAEGRRLRRAQRKANAAATTAPAKPTSAPSAKASTSDSDAGTGSIVSRSPGATVYTPRQDS